MSCKAVMRGTGGVGGRAIELRDGCCSRIFG